MTKLSINDIHLKSTYGKIAEDIRGPVGAIMTIAKFIGQLLVESVKREEKHKTFERESMATKYADSKSIRTIVDYSELEKLRPGDILIKGAVEKEPVDQLAQDESFSEEDHEKGDPKESS